MAEKALFCVPVYYGVVISLVFQVVVDLAYGIWSLWWLSQGHDDEIEILKSLMACSLALAIWELYGAFVGLVGLYGALRRKRYMKKFMNAQAFVWFFHLAICVWYLVVYSKFYKDKDVKECREKAEEGSGDDDDELCEHLLGFRTLPLAFVWLAFILEAFFQTAVMFFLFYYQRILNSYQIVEATETLPLTGVENSTTSTTTQPTRLSDSSLMETGRFPPSDSAAEVRDVHAVS